MRLPDEGDLRKVLIKFKEEGKVRIRRILTSVDSSKVKDHIPSNLKLNFEVSLLRQF